MLARTHRSLWLAALVACLAGCGGGCSKKDGEEKTSETQSAVMTSAKDAIVEGFANGSIAWLIGADGNVQADVTDKAGAPITKDVSGTISWTSESGEARTAKLAYDDGKKALVGKGPEPKQDVTEVKYEIKSPPGPFEGTLHVPAGGTSALAADAKTAADVKVDTTTGPHGGVVQVVGDDRVEIVADDDTDQVRVYILDASGKAVAVGDRKVTLAVNADGSEVVVLVPSADGAHLSGSWKAKSDPSRITVVVRRATVTHAAIVGWKPGTKLMVVGGPKVKVKVKGANFGPAKVVKIDGKDGPGGGPILKVDLKDKDKDKDKDDDKGKGKGGGNGNGNGNGKSKGK